MNSIVKFLGSEDINIKIKYNSILIVVNKLTKYIYFILYKKLFKAKQITWTILNRIIQYYEIPESITSDRDKIFTNKF